MSFSDANNGIIVSGTSVYRTYDSGDKAGHKLIQMDQLMNIGVCFIEGTDTLFLNIAIWVIPKF